MEETEERNCQSQEENSVFQRPNDPKRGKKNDETLAQEEIGCMKSLSEVVTKRDEYAVYGEHVAHRMRNCRRNRTEISLAQYYTNDIILNLDMGVYANSSMVRVPPNKCSHHWFHELSSASTSCSNRPIPSPSPTYTCMNSDISYLSSSSDLSCKRHQILPFQLKPILKIMFTQIKKLLRPF
jgi:hypothetical protein